MEGTEESNRVIWSLSSPGSLAASLGRVSGGNRNNINVNLGPARPCPPIPGLGVISTSDILHPVPGTRNTSHYMAKVLPVYYQSIRQVVQFYITVILLVYCMVHC
jgi:hypothetical protein